MSNQITVDSAATLLDNIRAVVEPLVIDNGQTFDRLKSVFLIAVQQNPDILKCSEESLRREISKCAADGLVPDSKEAVILPYKNSSGVFLANYQPMVMGIIKRMKELGGVFSIACSVVHKNDEFIYDEADPDALSHKPDRFASIEERGAIIGGYAVFRDNLRRVMHTEVMTMADFEAVRKASKAPNSPAWTIWPTEMYRKSVLRRGAKYISINNDKIRALIERQDEMFDYSQPRVAERVNPFTGQVLEHEPARSISHQQSEALTFTASQAKEMQPIENGQPVQEQSSKKAHAQKQKQEPVKTNVLPKVPDISIASEDKEKLVEAVEKVLAIATDKTISAEERRGVLKEAAKNWQPHIPEYAKPLIKACIDMVDWSIHKEIAGEPWTADHAVFVHDAKELLGVDKLKVGKYQ
ncbi:RecT family recombinase [Pseudochrobactrum asaccharolyticum]|uniref:Phage RecT family recombinase n=1 Tax=Pseudochrobactrum asaccharolyticum TaxID=354351 RepID=A0A366DK50_9HYPH|nr:RecT family recombinase [Pseudochrobactrum asaccharolyticum]RBO90453.1 phage RecT family recombinase [Pseudochrobactrum asaccharolyticum]